MEGAATALGAAFFATTAFLATGAADSSLAKKSKDGREKAGLAGAATGAALALRESSGLREVGSGDYQRLADERQ